MLKNYFGEYKNIIDINYRPVINKSTVSIPTNNINNNNLFREINKNIINNILVNKASKSLKLSENKSKHKLSLLKKSLFEYKEYLLNPDPNKYNHFKDYGIYFDKIISYCYEVLIRNYNSAKNQFSMSKEFNQTILIDNLYSHIGQLEISNESPISELNIPEPEKNNLLKYIENKLKIKIKKYNDTKLKIGYLERKIYLNYKKINLLKSDSNKIQEEINELFYLDKRNPENFEIFKIIYNKKQHQKLDIIKEIMGCDNTETQINDKIKLLNKRYNYYKIKINLETIIFCGFNYYFINNPRLKSEFGIINYLKKINKYNEINLKSIIINDNKLDNNYLFTLKEIVVYVFKYKKLNKMLDAKRRKIGKTKANNNKPTFKLSHIIPNSYNIKKINEKKKLIYKDLVKTERVTNNNNNDILKKLKIKNIHKENKLLNSKNSENNIKNKFIKIKSYSTANLLYANNKNIVLKIYQIMIDMLFNKIESLFYNLVTILYKYYQANNYNKNSLKNIVIFTLGKHMTGDIINKIILLKGIKLGDIHGLKYFINLLKYKYP